MWISLCLWCLRQVLRVLLYILVIGLAIVKSIVRRKSTSRRRENNVQEKIWDLDELDRYLETLDAEDIDKAVGLRVAYEENVVYTALVNRYTIGLTYRVACQACGKLSEIFYICRGSPG